MRNGRTKQRRADLRQLRLDILLLLEEQETRTSPEELPVEETAPASRAPCTGGFITIAQQMLDAIGGGQLRVMRKGSQTIEQRAAELFDEEQRQLKRRW
jgi:hypothetical protein